METLKINEANIIKVCINNETQIYNQFTLIKGMNDKVKINDEIINFLYEEIENSPKNNKTVIEFYAEGGFINTIKSMEKLIKDRISTKINIINVRIKKQKRNAIVLALVGMFLIGSTQVSQNLNRHISLHEFIIVISWVFMWKAIEIFFFEKMKLIKEKKQSVPAL
jgi:hypothetical protein